VRSRRTARGNRLGLALVALPLLALAGYTLLRGTGRLPGVPAAEPVVPASWRELARAQGWFWPAVAVGAGLVALLALRWLLVQARTGHESRLILDEDPYGATTVDARALTSTVAHEITSLPDVRRAGADLVHGRGPTRLWITMTIDDVADLDQLQAGLIDVLAGVRQSLEMDIPALIRLRVHSGRRATRVA
jgi:hypothetical protein